MAELTSSEITTWARDNPREAVATGRFLVKAASAKKPPPIPDEFDEMQEDVLKWAKAHPIRAKALFFSLLRDPKIKPYLEEDDD